jgi:class 3 adenylate cyclase
VKHSGQDQLQRKAVIDQGSALVTTLNDRLDYFGATMSRARRLQELAEPGELIMPARLALDEDLNLLLAEFRDQSMLRELPLNTGVLMLIAFRLAQ